MPSFEWYETLYTAPVDWSTQGDEWLYRLDQAISESIEGVAVAGHKFDSTTQPSIQVSLARSEIQLDTFVLLRVGPEAAVVFASGNGTRDDVLVSQIAAAAQAATRRLGEVGDEHQWSAIIGHGREREWAGLRYV